MTMNNIYKFVLSLLICLLWICYAANAGSGTVNGRDASGNVVYADNYSGSGTISYEAENIRFYINGGDQWFNDVFFVVKDNEINSIQRIGQEIQWQGVWGDGTISFSTENGRAKMSSINGLRSTSSFYLYFNYEDGVLYYSSSPIILGPSISSVTISAEKSIYCGDDINLSVVHNGANEDSGFPIIVYEKSLNNTDWDEVTYANGLGLYRATVCVSNGICVTSDAIEISAPDPEIFYSIPKTSISKSVDGQSQRVVIDTMYVINSCDEYGQNAISKSISNTTDFELVDDTILIIANEEGEYSTTLELTVAGLTKTINITGTVVNWPKDYTIKYCKADCDWSDLTADCWEDFVISTDDDGNINEVWHSDQSYKYFIPSNVVITCENFTLTSSAGDHCSWEFRNYGSILANESINIGSENKRLAGINSFLTECSSVMRAPYISIYRKQSLTDLKGTYSAEHLKIDHTEGGNLTVDQCTEIRANDATIHISGGDMNFNMNGHLISDNISINNPTTYVNMDGIMTLGNLAGGTKVIGGKNAIVNICINPTQSSDNFGMFAGSVLYNYGSFEDEYGWGENSNPKVEIDINDSLWVSQRQNQERYGYLTWEDVKQVKLYKAYPSYNDCINENRMYTFLMPIELTSFTFDNNTFIWTTASETNNDYFVVEYSKNGKDWVECTDYIYSASTTDYTYTTEPTINVNNSLFSYFRLKQVDYDGKFSYSDIITASSKVTNPCSQDCEKYKVFLRETNQWYRLVNGELIYCENDNLNK